MAACSFTHYGRTFTLTVEETSYSVENNTSDIKWTLSITGGGSTYYDSYAKATVNGTVVFNQSKGWSTYTFPAKDGSVSGTQTGIPHDNEGKASVSFALEGYCYYYTTQYTNGSLTLTTIPRASIPTCNNVTLGNAVTINTNRYSSSFTHTINIKQGSTTIETFTSIGASKSWTPAIATYAPKITSASTGTFTIECLTYSGSTHIGTKSCSVVLTVPSSVKPTAAITISEADATMIGKAWGVYVKGKSKISVKVTGTPIYSSPIASYSSSTNGQSSTSSSWTTNFLSTVGSNSVSATVKDKRGYTSNTASVSYTVVDYTKPTISTAVCARCDSSGNEKDNGTYLKYSFIGSIAAVNNKNTKEFKLGYKLRTASSYTYVTLVNNAYTISHSGIVLSGVTFSADSTYDIIFTATDTFESTTINREIGTGFDMINVHASGQSMAIGKKSEASDTDRLLEIAMRTIIGSDLTVSGGTTATAGFTGHMRYVDTRNENQNPQYYMDKRGTTFEFKSISKIGCGTFLSGNYCLCITFVPWGDPSGGMPVQLAVSTTGWAYRVASSETAWGSWYSMGILSYPVNSIYMSTSSTDPKNIFGGTWTKITDRFLIGAGNSYSAGGTGGGTSSSGYGSHSHTANSAGGHGHSFYWGSGSAWNGWLSTVESVGWRDHYNTSAGGVADVGGHTHSTTSSGSSFSIMPPYYGVYIWRRTG